MNDNKVQEFGGFDANLAQISAYISWKYSSAIERVECSLNSFISDSGLRSCSRMDLSLTKCYEDTTSSNTSFRGIVTDNDSGYISQNVESNSSVETATENRQVVMADLKDLYVNEDTLLEKPQIFSKREEESEDEYEEFGHLFFMSHVPGTPILNSSVASQKTNFSGFEGDESRVSDISATVSVVTPIKILSNVLNAESNSIVDVIDSKEQSIEISDPILPNNSKFASLENLNYINNIESSLEFQVEGNLDLHQAEKNLEPHHAEENSEPHHAGENLETDQVQGNLELDHVQDNLDFNRTEENLNSAFEYDNRQSIQSRITDTNNYNMSSFDSFYTFVCDLYTDKTGPVDDLANISINPKNLQINRRPSSPIESPRTNSYLQLETRNNSADNHAVPSTSTAVVSETKHPPVAVKNHPEITNSANKTTKKRSTPVKQQIKPNPPISPELFSDEELEPSEMFSYSMSQIQKTCDQMYITKNDRKLLKRAQESLGGVPPPPSVTIMQMTAAEMLQKISDNKHLFTTSSGRNSANILNVNSVDNCVNNEQKECVNIDNACNVTNASVQSKDRISEAVEKKESLLVTCEKKDVDMPWPNVMQYRYHGLHYNRSKISEEFEHLCVKYAERYIGAETQSSCTVFGTDVGSPSKRRFKLRRPAKSPGKRLSHLARRRITFSKDSLHSGVGPSSCSFIGSRTRQIMVDARKFELLSRRKSPRKKSPRKTPGKSPRRKSQTPSSSAKKRFAMRLKRYNTEDSLDSVSSASSSRASVTKRALFQSPPDKGETSNGLLKLFGADTSDSNKSDSSRRPTPRRALFTSPLRASPSKMTISSLYPAKRKATPKRALFKSPVKASSSNHTEVCDKKRKRTESDDVHPNKIARSMSLDVKDSSNESKGKTVMRSHSSSSLQSQDMAEHRKKKLMWAVAEALRSQNIDLKHPQFKVFASVLARVIRYFLPNLFTNGPRPEGSTTESMLRIARQYVFAVTRGKTVDQIIREAQHKARMSKPSGYVGLDKVDRVSDVSYGRNKENVLQDRVNIIGSDRTTSSETTQVNKNRRGENIERIRRVINFGDDDDNTSIR